MDEEIEGNQITWQDLEAHQFAVKTKYLLHDWPEIPMVEQSSVLDYCNFTAEA